MRPEARGALLRPVVVLGGTGFLGRRIGETFARQGEKVLLVSRTAPHSPASAAAGQCGTARLDLLAASPPELAAFLGSVGAGAVVNAAGRAWGAAEEQMAAANAELAGRVAEAVAALPGRSVRLVHLGTVHEYGAGSPAGSTGEDHAPAPVTAYGRTKLLGTQTVLSVARDRGIDAVVLRLANVIGAGVPQGSLLGRVAAHLAEAARSDDRGAKAAELRLPPLRAARDLVDARDAADAVVAAATAPRGVGGRVINVGRGEAVAMRGLIDRMLALSRLEIPVTEEEAGPTSRIDVARQCLDISRAARLLGWRPCRTLDDSLRELLASVLPNPHPSLDALTVAPVDEREP